MDFNLNLKRLGVRLRPSEYVYYCDKHKRSNKRGALQCHRCVYVRYISTLRRQIYRRDLYLTIVGLGFALLVLEVVLLR